MSAGSVIGTAISLGIIHVLTGPDHLSALATLCASERARDSFLLGLQWGLGHSIGLLLIGGIFIAITSHNNDSGTIEIPESVTKTFEYIVGVFMIMLGIFGIRRAVLKKRLRHATAIDIMMEDEENISTPSQELLPHVQGVASLSFADVGAVQEHNQPSSGEDPERDQQDSETSVPSPSPDASITPPQPNCDSSSSTTPLTCRQRLCRGVCCTTNAFLSLIAGLIHGMAGPGGVLGVIPAVQIRDPLLGALYLTTFCLFSTFTMGCFAAGYGRLFAKRIGWEFRIECFSSSLSLLVGILWLVLVGTGTMDEVFG